MYDVVVIGAGHAGVEAALASARLGSRVLLATLSIDSVAFMPCNPAIGGTGKGHLVREVDALGGAMGLAADTCVIQSRMLNRSKGSAVHSLRAQEDKRRYHETMLATLMNTNNLEVTQGEVVSIETIGGAVSGVTFSTGRKVSCKAVTVAVGVYLNSRIIIGDHARLTGPNGFMRAERLTDSLVSLGLATRRFKTGTPARLDGRSIDFDRMETQLGDEPPQPFSFMTDEPIVNKACCYLTYTNERTHEILRENLHRSPMYRGDIHGVGARYCPSIEDKIVRFADKERHQIFIEPEGLGSPEWYMQGASTSMPEDVQEAFIRSIAGLERARITRLAYAIEYDTFDPTSLNPALMVKDIPGLYMAGQVNGTSGYEEAAAQGIIAGINAGLYVKGEKPLTLSRDEAYIGVMTDDLTTKGTDEPYRMMTARAEYRLLLRQDNADLRLTGKAAAIGLATPERVDRMENKRATTQAMIDRLKNTRPSIAALNEWLVEHGEPRTSTSLTLYELLTRPNVSYSDIAPLMGSTPPLQSGVAEQVTIDAHYGGYIDKQIKTAERAKAQEWREIPNAIDYNNITGLRIEARQKLAKIRPATLGQASRVPGVSPADIVVLSLYIR